MVTSSSSHLHGSLLGYDEKAVTPQPVYEAFRPPLGQERRVFSGVEQGRGPREIIRTCLEQADVCLETVVEPAPDVVARRPPAMDHLVMAPAAAEVARPARPTRFLTVDVTVLFTWRRVRARCRPSLPRIMAGILPGRRWRGRRAEYSPHISFTPVQGP